MKRTLDGRLFAPELTALLAPSGDTAQLLAPRVGLWRPRLPPGDLVTAGTLLGELEILGVLHRVLAPEGAGGRVVAPKAGRRELPIAVGYGDPLLELEVGAIDVATTTASAAATASASQGLRFVAPLSGRYYARPAPDKPPFVTAGSVVQDGETVALLEVMKTFNRVTYGGDGLPARAKVKRVVPNDGDDIDEGDVILELEPVS